MVNKNISNASFFLSSSTQITEWSNLSKNSSSKKTIVPPVKKLQIKNEFKRQKYVKTVGVFWDIRRTYLARRTLLVPLLKKETT